MLIYYSYVATCLAAAVATAARTAIVAVAVLAATLWWKSRHKVVVAAFLAIVAVGAYHVAPDRWKQRMATIEAVNSTDTKLDLSASGRLAVWKWTLEFAQSHPFGGGFNAYVVNHPIEDGIDYGAGKAFHSMYFEVLGEQGYVGIAMFLFIFAGSIFSALKVLRVTRGNPELAWSHDLAGSAVSALLVLMAGGAFIGIGFQPWIWYVISLEICLVNYVSRSRSAEARRPRYVSPAQPLATGAPSR